jgi:hypothetical protein
LKELAARAADALRKEPGVEVVMVDGNRGELTALVNGRVVAKRWLIFPPSVGKILAAVRAAPDAGPAG